MHEVHCQKASRVINDDGVHPIPGQSHGSGSGDKTTLERGQTWLIVKASTLLPAEAV